MSAFSYGTGLSTIPAYPCCPSVSGLKHGYSAISMPICTLNTASTTSLLAAIGYSILNLSTLLIHTLDFGPHPELSEHYKYRVLIKQLIMDKALLITQSCWHYPKL